MADVFTPTVRWAQTKDRIFLTIELSDVLHPTVSLTDEKLNFEAYGHGARGEDHYEVEINFYKAIDAKASNYKVVDRYVEITVVKQKGKDEFWPRLVNAEKKPGWLKINFDRWKNEDETEEEEEEGERNELDKIKNISIERRIREDLEDEIEKSKREVLRFCKIFYLFTYNTAQAFGFLYIVVSILFKLAFYRTASASGTYDAVSDILATCQLAAFLEIINPAVGLVKTGVMAPFMQVVGRNLLLFLVIVPHAELHSHPVVCILFLTWSLVEIIRYPFYASQCVGVAIEPLIWLRYHAWIPLYPLGIACEVFLICKAIPLLDVSGRFSYPLPNNLNFSFNFALFLRLYIFLLLSGGFYLLKRMYILRQKRYGRKKKTKQL